MKRVLMVSPHFPPDTTAAAHRVRLLAPHLPEFGWEATVVTVDPRDYEGRLDRSLESLVPRELRLVRVRTLSIRWTRILGIGDLGIRAFPGLLSTCRELLRAEPFDCLFVTIFPSYPALLGPLLKRRAPIAFVLDYQDPWVGSWGLTTGPGRNGRPDLKSRLSRALAARLEPIAVLAADGITAVSDGTFEAVCRRIPEARSKPRAAIPLGGEPMDFEALASRARPGLLGGPGEGRFHISYVGTLLPMGFETLRSFLGALALLKSRGPGLYANLVVHFIGTSNQTCGGSERVLPEARRLGVAEVVREVPERIDYLDALDVLVRSDAILLMGSSEPHYTASKIYPALLARRPLLAIFHRESSVVSILERCRGAGSTSHGLVTYDDDERAERRVEAVYEQLRGVLESPRGEPGVEEQRVIEEFSARAMARRLSKHLDEVVAKRP